jgi:Macrocin-O-methyltransferase (TylF)
MAQVLSTLKRAVRSTGIADPIKHWLLDNIDTGFHTLSPDLLVGLVRAFELNKDLEGKAYYEFGLYRGFSIWFAEQIARNKVPADFPFYGFDSFAGLPPTSVDAKYYHATQYSAGYEMVTRNLRQYNADMERIKLFEGFFSPTHFAKLERTNTFKPAAIAVIDVDIYESCVDVLEFMRTRINVGTILIFDDYNDMDRSNDHGERKAVLEFEARTGMQKEMLFELGRECAGFRVTKAPR